MFDDLKKTGKVFIGIGIGFSAFLGFVLLVALEDVFKLIGLGVWVLGPTISIFIGIMVYGVGLKADEIRLHEKNSTLLELINKRLDKIILQLKEQKDDKSTISRKETINKVNKDINDIKTNINSFNSSFGSTKTEERKTMFDLNEEKVEEKKIYIASDEDDKDDEVDTLKIDYSTNIGFCVLFSNSLTLPYGDTIELEYAYNCKKVDNNVIFSVDNQTFMIDMNSDAAANEFYNKLVNKKF